MDGIVIGFSVKYKCPHCGRIWGHRFDDPLAALDPPREWGICRNCKIKLEEKQDGYEKDRQR